MNTNLIHNILNVVIALLGAATAFLVATGCTTLPTGALECSHSFIDARYTAVAIAIIGALKVVMNIARDGLAGLTKPQPPVQK